MNNAQRESYFGWRWPAACRTQGWDRIPAAEQEKIRRSLTLEATGGQTDSTKFLEEDQITALFELLKLKSNPEDLKAARNVANPEWCRTEDECRRLVYAINSHGLHRNYVQVIAKWYCRSYQVSRWEDLPAEKLALLIRTVSNRRHQKGFPRPTKPKPEPPVGELAPYQPKPRNKYAWRDSIVPVPAVRLPST